MVEEAWEHGHSRLVEDLVRFEEELLHLWPHAQVVADIVIGEGWLPKLRLVARAAQRVSAIVIGPVQDKRLCKCQPCVTHPLFGST